MSTVKKAKDLYEGQYIRCEILKPLEEPISWTSNDLRLVNENAPEEAEVADVRLLDEKEYNHTFMMPYGEYRDFEKEFGSRDAKILCIVLPKSGQYAFKRRIRLDKEVTALHMPADSMQEADRKAGCLVEQARLFYYSRKEYNSRICKL